jgi:LacI family transcriptional regulator
VPPTAAGPGPERSLAAPTIQDVAREAGVSVATVSRVLTGSRKVGADSERAVRAAAARISYKPNPHARSLRTRRSRTLGVVVPDLVNPFFGALTQAISNELRSTAMHILVACGGQDGSEEHGPVGTLVQGGVDAMLLACAHPEKVDAGLDVPVIELDRHAHTGASGFVGTDNAAGIGTLVDHLRGNGCETFAFAGSTEKVTPAEERLAAFRAYAPAGAQVLLGGFSLDWGRAAVDTLAESGQLPDAILCANDLIALGVMQRLRDRGHRVPEEVSVTGFDDIVFAELTAPALTTMRQPIEEIAATAVRMAMSAIESGGRAEDVRIAPELTVRGSTRRKLE